MLRIEGVTEEQAEEVATLENEIFSDAWSRQSIISTLRQPCAKIYGAREGRELAGYIVLYYVLDECEIARIAVKEGFRRRGVAGMLFAETVKFCRENKINKIMLDVRESNLAAIAFYKKNGFIQDGIRKRFYTNPAENAILMSRRIEL